MLRQSEQSIKLLVDIRNTFVPINDKAIVKPTVPVISDYTVLSLKCRWRIIRIELAELLKLEHSTKELSFSVFESILSNVLFVEIINKQEGIINVDS